MWLDMMLQRVGGALVQPHFASHLWPQLNIPQKSLLLCSSHYSNICVLMFVSFIITINLDFFKKANKKKTFLKVKVITFFQMKHLFR